MRVRMSFGAFAMNHLARVVSGATESSYTDVSRTGFAAVPANTSLPPASTPTPWSLTWLPAGTEAVRWNGKKWALVKTPQPGGTTLSGEANVLYSVACTSASYCSTIGYLTHTTNHLSEPGAALEPEEVDEELDARLNPNGHGERLGQPILAGGAGLP